MGYAELLNSLVLQPTTTLAEVGVPVGFTIVPDVTTAKVTEIRMVDVDLEFMAKGFAFPDADLDAWTPTGPLPIQDLVSNPPAVTPGVPGLLGRLRGQLPVAVPVEVAPRIEVTWKVRGRRPGDNVDVDLVARGDAYVTAGPGGTSMTVLFIPEAVEMARSDEPGPLPQPGTSPREVSAEVRMYAGSTLVGTRQLPPVRIEVRKLAIPSMLCLFLHKNYTGYMLVVVPPETAIYSLGYVTNRVQDLRILLAPFAGNPRLGFLVDALAIFHARLTAESHIQYRQTNQIANLNDITLETDWINTEAEDEMSSLLLFGPPGRSVDFFNARNFDYDEGVMTVTARAELVAGVRDLHNDFPTVEPIGASLLPRLKPPGSATFGDELSSLRFAPLI